MIAYNERVAAARDQIAGVRAKAEAQAARSSRRAAARPARCRACSSRSRAGSRQVQQAPSRSQQAAGRAGRQQTVSSWFGDWAIPQAIVMCESGGNFGAVNPSSGAGGAYQILPSTWQPLRRQRRSRKTPRPAAEPDRRADLGGLRVERLGVRPSESGAIPVVSLAPRRL